MNDRDHGRVEPGPAQTGRMPMPRPTRDDVPWEWPLGPVLKEARENRGLTQAQAATAAGFAAGTWNALETGYRLRNAKDKNGKPIKGEMEMFRLKPTASALRNAARAVGLDSAQVLELAGLDPSQATERALSGSEALRLADRVLALPVSQQRVLVTLVGEFEHANEE